jgi:hypothetical protein
MPLKASISILLADVWKAVADGEERLLAQNTYLDDIFQSPKPNV